VATMPSTSPLLQDSLQAEPPSRASDPKRLTRRHHYQQGPGFLFLATQGGRPPSDRLRPSLAPVRQRMHAVRLAREHGVAVACRETVCSRPSLYRWLAAYEAHGIAGLCDGSRRPHRSACIPEWVERVVITVRLLTYWNSKRIAAEMERRQIYGVGHDSIDRLLATKGCARGSAMRERGPRYERTRPNELWHIDIKRPFFIRLAAGGYIKTWIVGLVDDHSRVVVGLRIHSDAQAAPILRWLEDCFELCGQPLELMSDNGQPFVTWMPHVLTRFGKRLQPPRHLGERPASAGRRCAVLALRPCGHAAAASLVCPDQGDDRRGENDRSWAFWTDSRSSSRSRRSRCRYTTGTCWCGMRLGSTITASSAGRGLVDFLDFDATRGSVPTSV
jgi:Homeodomain-like domain/Integrase core domain